MLFRSMDPYIYQSIALDARIPNIHIIIELTRAVQKLCFLQPPGLTHNFERLNNLNSLNNFERLNNLNNLNASLLAQACAVDLMCMFAPIPPYL